MGLRKKNDSFTYQPKSPYQVELIGMDGNKWNGKECDEIQNEMKQIGDLYQLTTWKEKSRPF